MAQVGRTAVVVVLAVLLVAALAAGA